MRQRGKYRRAGQATDDNMAHEHCMLDNQGYKHSLRICNTYCFYTATMVTRTHLNVYVMRILSCYNRNVMCFLRGMNWVFKHNSG